MLSLIFTVAAMVVSAWTWAAIVMTWCRLLRPTAGQPAILRAVFHELRPFYLPSAVLVLVDQTMHDDSLFWRSFTFACSLANWCYCKYRFEYDDRWKRRKAKLVEKVRALGGRLTVEPAAS